MYYRYRYCKIYEETLSLSRWQQQHHCYIAVPSAKTHGRTSFPMNGNATFDDNAICPSMQILHTTRKIIISSIAFDFNQLGCP